MSLGAPTPCLSNFSLQFAQNLNLGRSSCDTLSLAFTVYVQIQLADCSKNTICGDPIVMPLVSSSPCMSNFSLQFVQNHSLERSSWFAFGLAFTVYVRLQAHTLLKNTIWGDPVAMSLVLPSPCMSSISLQFAQTHSLGRSSCDVFGCAFTVYVQPRLAVCSKTRSRKIQL